MKSCAEHRDEVVLDLVELDDRGAARGQLLVQLDVARGDREVLSQQSQREHVGGAERRRALDVEHVGGTAARAGDAYGGALLGLVEHAHVAACRQGDERVAARCVGTQRQVGRRREPAAGARSEQRRASVDEPCTPESSASTSTLGSSEANRVRAIEVIAVSRSFCIVSWTPRSTCSVMSRCTTTKCVVRPDSSTSGRADDSV